MGRAAAGAARLALAVLLAIAVAGAGTAVAELKVDDAVRAEDARRVDALLDVLAEGSAAKFAAGFAEDGVFEWDGNRTASRGRGAIEASWAPMLEKWTLAVRAVRSSGVLYPEPAEDARAPPAGERTVLFTADYAFLGRVPKKRSASCTGMHETSAMETVTFGADGLVRRWSSLRGASVEDTRRHLKCLGYADPEVAEENVPCFDVTDRLWSLLSAQRNMRFNDAAFLFAGALPDGAYADDEADEDESVTTFEGQQYDGAAGASRLLSRMFKGVAQTESHFVDGPFCPETEDNVAAVRRRIFMVTRHGCSTSVVSFERVQLKNNRKISRWDVVWDKSLEQVQEELRCDRATAHEDL